VLNHISGSRGDVAGAYQRHDWAAEKRAAFAGGGGRNRVGRPLVEHLAEDGALVFAHACRHGAEGIVSKKVDAPYRSGPHDAWIKTKKSDSRRRAAGAERELEQVIPSHPAVSELRL
jgi:hypothetical protein